MLCWSAASQPIAKIGWWTRVVTAASAVAPSVQVALALFTSMPMVVAVALYWKFVLSPGSRLPASNVRLLLPPAFMPAGRVSVTITPLSELLPVFLIVSVVGIGSQMITSAGSVLVNAMFALTTWMSWHTTGL